MEKKLAARAQDPAGVANDAPLDLQVWRLAPVVLAPNDSCVVPDYVAQITVTYVAVHKVQHCGQLYLSQ